MKIQYEERKIIDNICEFYMAGFIFITMFVFSIMLYINLIRYPDLEGKFITLGIALLSDVIPIFFIWLIVQHKNDKRLKDTGEKVKACIVATGVIKYRYRRHRDVYYVTVKYHGKQVNIYQIKNNKAYQILAMLLQPYAIKKPVEIPIDIYRVKNKIYADLESINLMQIEGFEAIEKEIERN